MINFLQKISNVIFPSSCVFCKCNIKNGFICDKCASRLSFITKPVCNICGLPLKIYSNYDDNLLCLNCTKNKPLFDKSISAVVYNDISKKIILPFKHGDKTYLKYFISNLMFQSGNDIISKCDFITPVPLHFFRLLKRKYNQSALLSVELCRKSGKPYLPLLRRIKFTKSQGHLSIEKRKSNVKKSFAINKKYLSNIIGKNILLIDDVITTGATVNECAKVLKNNGVNRVFVLTFCKVC